MNSPLVSVIIPLYNSQNYIASAIESIINQTYKNWELIIINDGSIDKSLSIAESYVCDNIIVLSQNNKGASAARNYGIKYSNGDYIQFLDADDILSSDKILNQVYLLNKHKNKIAVCSTIHFKENQNHTDFIPNPYEEKFLTETENNYEFLIRLWGGYDGFGSMVQPNAWLTPKEIIKKSGYWNEKLSLDDDGDFFCRVLLNSDGIIRDNKSFNYYRKFTKRNSLSSNLSHNNLMSQLEAIISKRNELFKRVNNNSARIAIANQFFNLCIISYIIDTTVYKLSRRELIALNVKPNLKFQIGGVFIELIKKVLGWRLTKRLALVKQKITSSNE